MTSSSGALARKVRQYLDVKQWVLASVLTVATAFGLDPRHSPSQYSLRVWQTADGLPDNFIQSIVQTREGYLWLGTLEGLVRFDGVKFTVFDTRNTPQLRSSSVVALCEQRDGTLWIGTGGGGITTWSDGEFRQTFTSRTGLAHDHIRSIYEDAQGDIWITAHAGGLVRYSRGRFTTLTTADGLPTNILRTVFRDRAGTLWIGADEEGLAALGGAGHKSLLVPSGQIRAFLEDRAGSLWIATRGGGLLRREDDRLRSFTTASGLPSNAIRTLLEDSDGNLWIGTESGGLARWRDGRFATLSTREGLPHNFVRALYEDTEGNLWVGTRGGLARLKDRKVATWTTADGLPTDNIRAVMEDSAGRVWLGTAAGAGYLKDNRYHPVRLSADWARDQVRSFLERRDGSVWIGGHTGLFRWSAGEPKARPVDPALRDIHSMAEDAQGRLWVGTAGHGVFVDGANPIPKEPITALAPDGDAMWIGTTSGLLWRQGEAMRRYTTRDGLGHDIVTALYRAADGTLWIGTRGGLSRFKNGAIRNFTRRDGLLSDNIRAVVDDGRGHLWISSVRGVARVDKSELDEFAAGRIDVIRARSLGTADGMKAAECNGDAQPSGWRTRDGRIWFPTIHGAVAFDPTAIKPAAGPLRLMVERVVNGSGALVLQNGSVRVPPGPGDLQFDYTAISLAAPERIRFRYRLVGFDADWVDADQRRSAFYTQVPPGDFRFEVMAYPNESSSPPARAAVGVHIEPRFYRSTWFYLLSASIVAVIATLAYRLRLRSLRRSYEAIMMERARIGREIHDTLIQGVTGVALQLEAASLQIPEFAAETKSRITRALDQLDGVLGEARQCILELRAPESPSDKLEDAIRILIERTSADRGITATLDVQGESRCLPAHIQRNLLRVAREAITNAALHSRAAHLSITLRYRTGGVQFHIVDDGVGFDASSVAGNHFGLVGMRERVAEIGGAFDCRTAPGQGTVISVAVEEPA